MTRLPVLNLLLIGAIGVALVVLAFRGTPSPGIELIRREAAGQLDQVVVHVSGAVRSPGVYTVAPGDRVVDLVELAGGLSDQADGTGVNLALRLRDQDRIHVPMVSEESPLLDLNTATAKQLEELPGIGPVYASRIIEAREPFLFTSSEDLLEAEVIPAHVYEGIRTLVTVTSP